MNLPSPSSVAVVAIVDDDPSLRRSVRNLLRSAGFAVETFPSAEAFLSARPATLGCLVLDLRLSGMSGLELLRTVSADGSGVPTVILTAHGDAALRGHCLAAGALAYMEKPFSVDALLGFIQGALASGGVVP